MKCENLQWRINQQRKWIKEHGGTRAGYRERYGVKGETTELDGIRVSWYGDGGDAIYEADRAELARLEAL